MLITVRIVGFVILNYFSIFSSWFMSNFVEEIIIERQIKAFIPDEYG